MGNLMTCNWKDSCPHLCNGCRRLVDGKCLKLDKLLDSYKWAKETYWFKLCSGMKCGNGENMDNVASEFSTKICNSCLEQFQKFVFTDIAADKLDLQNVETIVSEIINNKNIKAIVTDIVLASIEASLKSTSNK
jgi:hypothetical protein